MLVTATAFPSASTIGEYIHRSTTHLALIMLVTATPFPSASTIGEYIHRSTTHLALIMLVTATPFPSASTIGEYIHRSTTHLALIMLVTATPFPSASTIGEYIHRSTTHLALIMLVIATAFPSASTTHRWIYSQLYHLSLIMLVTATAFPSASTTHRWIYSQLYHLSLIMLVTAIHSIHNRQVNKFNTLPLIILFPSASTTGEHIHRYTTHLALIMLVTATASTMGEYIHRSTTHLALIMLVTATAFPSASTTHRWIYSPLYHLSLIVLVTATASTTDRRMYSPLYHPPGTDSAGDCHSIHNRQKNVFTALPPTCSTTHLPLIVLVTATASTTDRRMYSPLYHPPAIDRAGDCHSIHNRQKNVFTALPPTCHWSCWWLPQHPQQTEECIHRSTTHLPLIVLVTATASTTDRRMYSPLYHPPAIDRAGDCHSIPLSVHDRQVSCAGGSAVVKRWPVVWRVVGRVVCDPWPDVVSIGTRRQVGNQL